MSVDRLEATKALVSVLNDELVVAALGNPAYDLFLAGDRRENYYMWGAMGLAGSVGLGLAIAAPKAKVVVLDGDGSVLMNLGSLATTGTLRPRNLVHIVWDNRAYDLTGGQATATAHNANLVEIAKASGIERCSYVETHREFTAMLPAVLSEPGPWFIVVDTGPTSPDRVKPQAALRRRFVQIDSTIDCALAQGRARA